MSEQELHHAGVKGMRWGVRRYQNKDGSVTTYRSDPNDQFKNKRRRDG